MSVPKHWLLVGWHPRELIVHQQRYRPCDSNKIVDISFSAHDAFLESLSSEDDYFRGNGKFGQQEW